MNKNYAGWIGKDGFMTEGFSTKEEAQIEFNEFYSDEFDFCEIVERSSGEWVIAYL